MEPSTEFCRRCRRETRWIASGGQNGSRPVSTNWRCSACGYERVQLGSGRTCVSDVEALALTIVGERRRGSRPSLASGREIDGSAEDEAVLARIDYEDAAGHVREAIVVAYYDWNPERNPSLLSHATWKARCALSDWFRELLGRDTPKALTWAYSSDVAPPDDEIEDEERSVTIGAIAALAEGSITHALVVIEDEETRSTLREIALPISLGYSHAEVARMHGQTEGWVSSRLRRLRERDDLRIPA